MLGIALELESLIDLELELWQRVGHRNPIAILEQSPLQPADLVGRIIEQPGDVGGTLIAAKIRLGAQILD